MRVARRAMRLARWMMRLAHRAMRLAHRVKRVARRAMRLARWERRLARAATLPAPWHRDAGRDKKHPHVLLLRPDRGPRDAHLRAPRIAEHASARLSDAVRVDEADRDDPS